jgi:hypothetical protein
MLSHAADYNHSRVQKRSNQWREDYTETHKNQQAANALKQAFGICEPANAYCPYHSFHHVAYKPAQSCRQRDACGQLSNEMRWKNGCYADPPAPEGSE